jgi:CheY-like chemotaxis protein
MRKHRILLADDTDDIRAVFQEGLESRGFEVVPAATVNEALRLISTESFDSCSPTCTCRMLMMDLPSSMPCAIHSPTL